jgi:hypothetical protein
LKNVRICLCPYVPNGRFIEALKTKIKDIRKDTDFYFSHVCVNNMKMGAIVVNDADDWKEDYPPLFVGHEHTFQEIAKNCICTGSSISTSSSEGTDKYLIVLNINAEHKINETQHIKINEKHSTEHKVNENNPLWSYDKIVLDLPRNKTIYYKNVKELKDVFRLDEKSSPSMEVKKTFLDQETKCSYRLVVHGPEEEFKAFIKTSLYHDISSKAKIVWKESHTNTNNNEEKENTMILSKTIDFNNKRDRGFFEIFLNHIKDTSDLLQVYNELYGEENE